MSKIKLGKEVMISDPCYVEPTWCQHKLKNVLPGEYSVYNKYFNAGNWGVRNSMLIAVHQDYEMVDNLRWKKCPPIRVLFNIWHTIKAVAQRRSTKEKPAEQLLEGLLRIEIVLRPGRFPIPDSFKLILFLQCFHLSYTFRRICTM
jgi:hypothetical protein